MPRPKVTPTNNLTIAGQCFSCSMANIYDLLKIQFHTVSIWVEDNESGNQLTAWALIIRYAIARERGDVPKHEKWWCHHQKRCLLDESVDYRFWLGLICSDKVLYYQHLSFMNPSLNSSKPKISFFGLRVICSYWVTPIFLCFGSFSSSLAVLLQIFGFWILTYLYHILMTSRWYLDDILTISWWSCGRSPQGRKALLRLVRTRRSTMDCLRLQPSRRVTGIVPLGLLSQDHVLDCSPIISHLYTPYIIVITCEDLSEHSCPGLFPIPPHGKWTYLSCRLWLYIFYIRRSQNPFQNCSQ